MVFCRPVSKVQINKDGKEEENTFFVMKEHTVFNLDQVTGPRLDQHRREAQVRPEFPDYGPADRAQAPADSRARHDRGGA